jgi:hypothetical protein
MIPSIRPRGTAAMRAPGRRHHIHAGELAATDLPISRTFRRSASDSNGRSERARSCVPLSRRFGLVERHRLGERSGTRGHRSVLGHSYGRLHVVGFPRSPAVAIWRGDAAWRRGMCRMRRSSSRLHRASPRDARSTASWPRQPISRAFGRGGGARRPLSAASSPCRAPRRAPVAGRPGRG